MAKYIKFVEVEPCSRDNSRVWVVENKKAGTQLGAIEWYSKWRQFVFGGPDPYSVYSPDCLRDIADFCEKQTKARKTTPTAAPPQE